MMRHFQSFGAFAILLSALTLAGCSKKDIGNTVNQPCNGKEYMDGQGVFRANGTGVSPDISMAKEMAYAEAFNSLGRKIKTKVQSVTDRSMNQAQSGSGASFTGLTEQFATIIVDQEVSGAVTICDELTKEGDTGMFRAWICIELSGDKIAEKYIKRVSELSEEEEYKARFFHNEGEKRWKEMFMDNN